MYKRIMIRVGTIKYKQGGQIIPNYPGFTNVLVLTKSSAYGSLGPYVIKHNNMIFENFWQFGKLYEKVPKSKQTYSRFDNTVVWDWPEETHIIEGEITEEYWNWRETGMNCPYAIRYPVGKKHRSKCICYLTDEGEQLNYVQSRCLVYCKYYMAAVKEQPQFHKLKTRLEKERIYLL